MKWILIVGGALVLLIIGYSMYMSLVVNPRVLEELTSNPDSERAARVMLMTFADGRVLPVNYLIEGDTVFAGADGRWWREFQNDGAPVTLLIRGQTLHGHARVELEDKAYIADVFSRLRPAASWVPEWLDAKLVVVALAQPAIER